MCEEWPSSQRRKRDKFRDENWIQRVTMEGYTILAKDSFKREHERQRIVECGARVFSIPSASLKLDAMVARFLASKDKIFEYSLDDGPYFYAVLPDSVEKRPLPDA